MAGAWAETFLSALDVEAGARFESMDVPALNARLDELRKIALAAHAELDVEPAMFIAEIARRGGALLGPEHLAQLHAADLHLAIACAGGDARAIRKFEAEVMGEVDAAAAHTRARSEHAEEVRAHVRRVLFIEEPGRRCALREFSGRGSLRAYVRVIATRELVRVINKGRREIAFEDAFFEILFAQSDPELGYLREHYREDIRVAMRVAISSLSEQAHALLRYSLIDGWSIDRIGTLYGIHRATAARRLASARDELGAAIRAEVAARLTLSINDVDSIIRLVQSQVDLSLERLLSP